MNSNVYTNTDRLVEYLNLNSNRRKIRNESLVKEEGRYPAKGGGMVEP